MNIMSLRGAFFVTKQSPVRGGLLRKVRRNDMWAKVNVMRGVQSPPLHCGDATQSAGGDELRPFVGRTLLPFAEGATIGSGV